MTSTAEPETIFAPPTITTVAIKGTELRFPVNRIFCVGRNYEAHAKEMGMAVDRESPFYFTKSASSIVESGTTVPYPPGTSNYHHEMELVVAIEKPAFCVSIEHALEIVFGYACGLDMTRRDLQLNARDKGRPWDLGKNFENSAVISEIVTARESGHINSGDISLSVNKDVRQSGDISDLIWNVPDDFRYHRRVFKVLAEIPGAAFITRVELQVPSRHIQSAGIPKNNLQCILD